MNIRTNVGLKHIFYDSIVMSLKHKVSFCFTDRIPSYMEEVLQQQQQQQQQQQHNHKYSIHGQ